MTFIKVVLNDVPALVITVFVNLQCVSCTDGKSGVVSVREIMDLRLLRRERESHLETDLVFAQN